MNLETQFPLIFKWPDGSNVSSNFLAKGEPNNNNGKVFDSGCKDAKRYV